MATPQQLFDWFNTQSNQLLRGNGVPYTIYREDVEDPVYPQDSLFSLTVDGYVIVEDENPLRDLIEEGWDSVTSGMVQAADKMGF